MANEIKRDTVDYRDPTPFDNTKLNSLSDISKALRHKTYGEDTREAIAQQGEALVKLMTETGGNQSAEVMAARGPFELLGIRENAQENAIAVTNSKLTNKADKDYIENYLSQVNYSPEMVANLADLEDRYPAGKPGLFIASDTDHKYFWENNKWQDKGVYGSKPIQDGGISPVKLAPNATAGYIFSNGTPPNFNQIDQRFEITSTFSIMYGGSIYAQPRPDLPIYVKHANGGLTGFVCFNSVTHEFAILSDPIPKEFVVLGGFTGKNGWLNGRFTINGHTDQDGLYDATPAANIYLSNNQSRIIWDTKKRMLSITGAYLNYGGISAQITDGDYPYGDGNTQRIFFNRVTKMIEIVPNTELGQSRIMLGWLSHTWSKIYLPTCEEWVKVVPEEPGAHATDYLTSVGHAIALGDSITYGALSSDPQTKSWPALVESNTGKKMFNEGKPGATWQNGSSDDVISFVNRAKLIDWKRANTIVIFGGTNDFGQSLPVGEIGDSTDKTMIGAMNTVIIAIYKANPKARILLATPMWRARIGAENVDVETTPNSAGLFLREYVEAVKQVGNKYNLPVLDLYHRFSINSLNSSEWMVDGLHPNDDGYGRLAEIMAKFIMTSGA